MQHQNQICPSTSLLVLLHPLPLTHHGPHRIQSRLSLDNSALCSFYTLSTKEPTPVELWRGVEVGCVLAAAGLITDPYTYADFCDHISVGGKYVVSKSDWHIRVMLILAPSLLWQGHDICAHDGGLGTVLGGFTVKSARDRFKTRLLCCCFF